MRSFRILERILFEKIREAKYPDTYDFLLEGNYLTDQEFCKHIKQKQSQMGQLVRYLLLVDLLFIKGCGSMILTRASRVSHHFEDSFTTKQRQALGLSSLFGTARGIYLRAQLAGTNSIFRCR